MSRTKRTLSCYGGKWYMVEPTHFGFQHTELGTDRKLRNRDEAVAEMRRVVRRNQRATNKEKAA